MSTLVRRSWGNARDLILYYPHVFTSLQCRRILNTAMARPVAPGRLGQRYFLSKPIRRSAITIIEQNPSLEWIWAKLRRVISDANDFAYRLPFLDLKSRIQFSRYVDIGDHYSWHRDVGKNRSSTRRISVIVQLSEGEDYRGGNLEFRGLKGRGLREQGAILVFPSHFLHRVTPLLWGERYSLAT